MTNKNGDGRNYCCGGVVDAGGVVAGGVAAGLVGAAVPRSRFTVGATGVEVSTGFAGWSCRRSLVSPFLRFTLVFLVVSPLRPRGVA